MKFSKKQIRELKKRLLCEGSGTTPKKARPKSNQAIRDAQRAAFMEACLEAGLPEPVPEVKFHPVRKWRFDWLFGDRVAVEIQGGVWTRGRHSRGSGQVGDMEKFNEAQILGYVVLQFTPEQIKKGKAFLIIKRALEGISHESV